MSDTRNAAATADRLRHEITEEFHHSTWPNSKVLDHIFDDIAKDPAKFNAVVAAMEKQNTSSHDGLIVKDYKTILGNVEQVTLEYHTKPGAASGQADDQVGQVNVIPEFARDRRETDWKAHQAELMKHQPNLSFYVGTKSLDKLAEEVHEKVNIALHDSASVANGRNESLFESFRKLDPSTFDMLAARLDRENSFWSRSAQVKVYPASDGWPTRIAFEPGTFDFKKPVINYQMYYGPVVEKPKKE